MLLLTYTKGRCLLIEKNDLYPCNINVGSNLPKKKFKQIPNSIIIRLSINSSNDDILTQNKKDYEIALKIVCMKKNIYKWQRKQYKHTD